MELVGFLLVLVLPFVVSVAGAIWLERLKAVLALAVASTVVAWATGMILMPGQSESDPGVLGLLLTGLFVFVHAALAVSVGVIVHILRHRTARPGDTT